MVREFGGSNFAIPVGYGEVTSETLSLRRCRNREAQASSVPDGFL